MNFVELDSPMLDAKFQVHRTSGSRENVFKGVNHLWAWWPSWSCDLDNLYKLWFPLPKEDPHKIWLRLAKRFQWRRCLKLLMTMTTTTDARVWVYYELISSPCDPNCSGELISKILNA